MNIRIAESATEWNGIVEKSPYSVLHHRYEISRIGAFRENPLPLIIEEGGHYFLVPLRISEIFKSFRLAVSPVYDYASILPDNENSLSLMPSALDKLVDFLRNNGVIYLSLCGPAFRSKEYVTILNSWFKKRNSHIDVLYAEVIKTGNKSFETILKHKFDKLARYNIRRAEREGVTFIEIDADEDLNTWIDDIHECNLSALKRQGREGAYPDSNKGVYLSELISTKKILGDYYKIYGAVYNGRLIAYMILCEYNKFMQVGKAMSHTAFLNKRPNDALIAYIVKKACENGFELIEYGLQTRTLGTPSLHEDLDLFRAKFGFERIPLFIYRLGISVNGRILQHLFSAREFAKERYARVPEFARNAILRFYAPRRREVSTYLDV